MHYLECAFSKIGGDAGASVSFSYSMLRMLTSMTMASSQELPQCTAKVQTKGYFALLHSKNPRCNDLGQFPVWLLAYRSVASGGCS